MQTRLAAGALSQGSLRQDNINGKDVLMLRTLRTRGIRKRGNARKEAKVLSGKTIKATIAGVMMALLVTGGNALAAVTPVPGGVSPSPASFTAGTAGTLTANYSDNDGWQDLRNAYLLVTPLLSQKANAVYVRYTRKNNTLSLRNDSNSGWSSGCVPGSSKTISNSQVTINCAASSANGSGTALAITLDLNFSQATAGGSFNVFQRAVDRQGLASAWVQASTLTVTSAGVPTPPPSSPPPSSPDSKYDWVSYYGSGKLTQLVQFRFVDIDVEDGASNYTAADVGTLKAGGSTVVSYLNIGAAETFRSYWQQASVYKLSPYDGWPGEYWMDVSNPGFRDLIVNTVAPQLVSKGADGFYLDNIDVVDEYPQRQEIRQGVVELVRQLRAKYPDKIIIGQTWGLTPLGDTGADGRKMYQYLNGISKEEVNSTYSGGYQKIQTAESDAMIRELADWKAKGLDVFTLDYALTESLASYDYSRSLANGFRPYAANKDLDNVYFWSFAPKTSYTASVADGPELVLTKADPYWASYTDYSNRTLTVGIRITNIGLDTAQATSLKSASASSLVTPVFDLPVVIGDLQSGDGADLQIRYKVAPGVSEFMLNPGFTCIDGQGKTVHSGEPEL